MKEFLMTCYQGIYPHYGLIALSVIVYRIASGRWKRKETLLLFLFLSFYLGLIIQVLAVDHASDVSRRYLVPFTPLLFGFTAWGVVWFYYWLKRPFLFFFLALLIISVLLWDSTGPIVKEYYTQRRIAENSSIEEISAFIASDYKGEKTRGELPVWWYEPRVPSRPILKDAPFQLTFKVGGSNWSEFFPDDPVDYLIRPAADKTPPDGYVLVFETESYNVFKPVNGLEAEAEVPGNMPVPPAEAAADISTPSAGGSAGQGE